MSDTTLSAMVLVQYYRSARDTLLAWKQAQFPPESIVSVDHPRYHGYGIVSLDDRCAPDQLAVVIPNANTWFYEVETCAAVPRGHWQQVPAAVKRMKRSRAAKLGYWSAQRMLK